MAHPLADRNRLLHRLANALRLAMDSIRAHKLRTALTLLGTMIGVASVVLVGAAIQGLGAYAEQSTSKAFGGDAYTVQQVIPNPNVSRREYIAKMKRNREIHMPDAAFVKAMTGAGIFYSAQRQQGDVDIKRGASLCEDSTVNGVSSEMADIRDLDIADGRFFTPLEEQEHAHVAVIGDEIRISLFGSARSPLGTSLKIDGVDFVVIGVQAKQGSSFGASLDKNAYVPITVFNRLYGSGTGLTLFGRSKPHSGLSLGDALDKTRAALRARFHVAPGDRDNFDSQTPEALRGFIDQILNVIAAAVVPLTLISLLVGGIVIMNIMLVSVTERTAEIGLRKALGAKFSDLMTQLLFEAISLSVLGGMVGVGVATLAVVALSKLLGVPLTVSVAYILLALGVSTLVGALSGWYPALRAAKLEPVEALRAD